MNTLFHWLRKIHWSFFIVYGVVVFLLMGWMMNQIAPPGSNSNPVADKLEEELMIVHFVELVIAGPLLETFLFQFLPFHFFRWFTKGQFNFYLCLFFSATLFGANHPYNIYYIILTSFSGAFLIHLFYAAKLRRQNAFFLVFAVHALNNWIAFLGI